MNDLPHDPDSRDRHDNDRHDNDRHDNDRHDNDDLDARIRSMLGAARDAAPPAPQLDLDPSVVPLHRQVAPGRNGRGWMWAALATVGTAAAVAAAVLVMSDDSTERLQPAPPATEPGAVSTLPDSAPDSSTDSTQPPTTTAPADPSVTWMAYAAGPEGVVGVESTGRTVSVLDETMTAVAAGPDSHLYVQRRSGPDGSVQPNRYGPEDTMILRFDPATSELVDADVPQPAGTWLRLHDVGTLAGAEVILYEEMQTPNPGGDVGRLMLLDIGTGDTTVVDDDFGGWERWSNLFQVADNGLIVGEKVDLTETYPTIYRVLDSAPEITPGSLGLQPSYSECSTECPRHLTVDPTGTAFAYAYRNAVSWLDGDGRHWTELSSTAISSSVVSQVMVTSDAVAVVSAPADTLGADSTTSVRILTLDGREIEAPGTSVSLYSEVPVPAVTDELDPTDVDGMLVVDQRVVTGDDQARLPDDRAGTGLTMSCAGPQSRTWEYDAGFAPSESGFPARNQLTSAIAEVNSEFMLSGTAGELPTTGWTMIVDGSNRWFVLPTVEGPWWAVVSVAGKPWADAWRYYDAWFCNEGPVSSPDDPFVPTPELAPEEDGMFAVTNNLGDALTYGSAQEAADALVAALTQPDGCDVDPTADVENLGVTATSTIYRIEYRFGCDDAGGGFDLEITVTSPAPDTWTITAATLQTYCLRGATDDGLCI
jgi:hypothetical protein